MEPSDSLWLADWRRRVAELYARWRAESARDAARATADFRAARDELFRTHPQSPLPTGTRAGFGGVPYFDYDPAYRIEVTLEPLAEPTTEATANPIALPVSGDEPYAFRRFGQVRLVGPLDGTTLSMLWIDGYAGGLFLPFRDTTSGAQTYGAGRYLLDTIKGADLGGDPVRGTLLLDFNMAYNPSCS